MAHMEAIPDTSLRMADCDPDEVRQVWSLRDQGFQSVLVREGLMRCAIVERVEASALIKAMKAKGSTKYGTGSGLGRGEGAKEILGTIAV